MKRTLIVIVISSFFINSLNAQTSKSSKLFNKSIFSIRIIKSSSNVNDSRTSSPNNLYSAGVSAKWVYLISEKFALSTEPMFHNKGYLIDPTKVNINYFSLPISIERVKEFPLFTPNDILTIGLGFYGANAIGGTYKTTNSTKNVPFGNTKTDERIRTDYGINFTTSLSVAKSIEIGFMAQLGIANVLPKDFQVNGNKTTTTSLGLFIGVNSNILSKKKKSRKVYSGISKNKEEELAKINGMQQNLFLLIGNAAIGFKSYELSEKSKTDNSTIYYSKANPLMLSSNEEIEEVDTKTNYIASYTYKKARDVSFQAFFTLPSTNKSSVAVTIQKDKTVNTADKRQFNLYLGKKLVGSFTNYLNKELSVIKIYELSF